MKRDPCMHRACRSNSKGKRNDPNGTASSYDRHSMFSLNVELLQLQEVREVTVIGMQKHARAQKASSNSFNQVWFLMKMTKQSRCRDWGQERRSCWIVTCFA